MPLSIKTDQLPTAERPPVVYEATVSAFELRKSADRPETVGINVVLQSPVRGKRFDNIWLRRHWFDKTFDPAKITDTKERNAFFVAVGAKNRIGKVKRYLGQDHWDMEFDTPEELVQVLQAVAVGRKFVVKEVQQRDAEGMATDRYNLNLYDLDRLPKSWPEGSLVLLEEED